MTTRGPRMLCLREIHQLRATLPLTPRSALARLFRRNEAWGLLDGSGALWPVNLVSADPELVPRPLDWVEVSFAGDGQRLDATGPTASPPLQAHLKAIATRCQSGKDDSARLNDGSEVAERLYRWVEETHFVSGFSGAAPFPELVRHDVYQQVLRAVRHFFCSRGYREIEAPVCVRSGGMERYLSLFGTQYVDYDGTTTDLQLATSPEFALKKALARGESRVFALAPSFRNGGERSAWHRPQFTMLEWYNAGSDLESLVSETAALINEVRRALAAWSRPGFRMQMDPVPHPPPVLFIPDLYQEYFSVDLLGLLSSGDSQALYAALRPRVPSVKPDESVDVLFWKSFCDVIEPQLRARHWAVLTGFPEGYASLARPDESGLLARRFEMFAKGVEICNGYVELTDYGLMARRFAALELEREGLQRDPTFEAAMAVGLPPCSGNALGIERLVSILADGQGLLVDHGLGPFA